MSFAALTNISKRSSHIHYVASFLGLLSLILIASYSGHLSDKQPGYGAIILIACSMQKNGNFMQLKTVDGEGLHGNEGSFISTDMYLW